MKVKYIGESDVSVINGNTYEVLAVESGWYRIVDETEEDYVYPPDQFEIIEE